MRKTAVILQSGGDYGYLFIFDREGNFVRLISYDVP